MILIVGATGQLGGSVCRELARQGRPVQGLVRPHHAEKVEALGVATVPGDLKDPAALAAACRGVDTVISTASSSLSRREGDDIESVDHLGQLNLMEAARQAGVRHFIFISFPVFDRAFPLQDAKRAVEARLAASGMAWTVLRPTHFRDIWFSPAVGFDLAGGTVNLFGEGDGPVNWIAMDDVRDAVVACLDNPRTVNQIVPLAGVEALSQHQVAERFRERGHSLAFHSTPLSQLEAMYHGPDPLQQSLAALMLACTGAGCPLQTPESWELLGLSPRLLDGFIAAASL